MAFSGGDSYFCSGLRRFAKWKRMSVSIDLGTCTVELIKQIVQLKRTFFKYTSEPYKKGFNVIVTYLFCIHYCMFLISKLFTVQAMLINELGP